MSRGDLREAEWRVLRDLLPTDPANRGAVVVPRTADCKAYDTVITLPEQAPKALLADKRYNADAICTDLARRGIQAVFPSRSNRRVKIEHDRPLYRERNRMERFLRRLKINRAIATRYDQRAKRYLGMAQIAAAKSWYKFVHASQRLI